MTVTGTDTAAEPTSIDEPIFHLAVPEDWVDAFVVGEYTMSTRGATLEQEGFIHCSTRAQIVGTANRFYGDLDQLVVLTIDPHLVPSTIIWESPGAGLDVLFPHIYGPVPVAAVNLAVSWRRLPDTEWSTDNL